MQMLVFCRRFLGFAAAVVALVFSAAASADPPARVARLGYAAGAVSFSAAGADDWVQATVNRPLSIGDRLWLDAGASAEVQDGGTMIRLNANSAVSLLNFDDQGTQLQLTQGVLNIRVRRLAPKQMFEVVTPQLVFTLRQIGDYRIAVDADGSETDIIVRAGQGEVSGAGAAYLVDAQQRYRFRSNDLRDFEFLAAPALDAFDRWAADRDRALDNSVSARYVSRDVVGYQDLDAHGNWMPDSTYGTVWFPNRVAADWAPYRDGHWLWIEPWGWTWIDDAPWGFAVSHYGRWARLGNRWAWVPGPVRSSAYYAPALVVFIGGDNLRLSISGAHGGIGWFPLAPREVYRPAYASSRSYFESINRSNTRIGKVGVSNSYKLRDGDEERYANRHIPGAVIAVPRNSFVGAQHVPGAALRLSPELLGRAPLLAAPAPAPDARVRHGAAVPGAGAPPPRAFERPGASRGVPYTNLPPPARVPAMPRPPVKVMPTPLPPVQLPSPQPQPQPQPQAQPQPQRQPQQSRPQSQPQAQPQAQPQQPQPQQPQPQPQPQAQPQPQRQPQQSRPQSQPQAQPQAQPQQPQPPSQPQAQPQPQRQPQAPQQPLQSQPQPNRRAPEVKAPVPPDLAPAPVAARPAEARAPQVQPKSPVPVAPPAQVGPKEESRVQKPPPTQGQAKEPEEGRDAGRRQDDRRKLGN